MKWFSQFTYADRPRTLREVASPTFLALAALSILVIGALAFADEWLRSTSLAKRIDAWLEPYRGDSMAVLRVGAGATMLMAWQAGTLLAPELPAVHDALGWAQFAIVLLLLVPQTVPAAGVLLGALWLYAAFSFAVPRPQAARGPRAPLGGELLRSLRGPSRRVPGGRAAQVRGSQARPTRSSRSRASRRRRAPGRARSASERGASRRSW